MATDIDYTIRLDLNTAKQLSDTELCLIYQGILKKKQEDKSITAKESRNFELAATILLSRYNKLILKTCRKYSLSYVKQVEFEDILASAKMGFLSAVEKFDPSVSDSTDKTTLGVYARFIISRFILDYVHTAKAIIRQPLTKSKVKAEKIIPREDTLENYYNVAQNIVLDGHAKDLNQAYRIMENYYNFTAGTASLNKAIGNSGNNTLMDMIADENWINADQSIINSETSSAIKEMFSKAFKCLSPIQKACFLLHKGITPDCDIADNKFSYREIADIIYDMGYKSRFNKKMSVENVRLIVNKATLIIQKEFKKNGLTEELLQNL